MTQPTHIDLSSPERPGSCVATGKPLGRVDIDSADQFITISNEIVDESHADWAWHHRCEVGEGFVRINGDNLIVTYQLTGDRDQWGNWHAVKISELPWR